MLWRTNWRTTAVSAVACCCWGLCFGLYDQLHEQQQVRGVSEVAFNPFDAFYPVLNSFERRGSTVGYALRKGLNPGKALGIPPFFQRLKDHHDAAFAV